VDQDEFIRGLKNKTFLIGIGFLDKNHVLIEQHQTFG